MIQFIQNISITASPDVCGSSDVQLAFYSTFVPWVIIFTLFTILLISSPGWLRVFSNTFGVSAAEAYGIEEHIQDVLRKPAADGGTYEYQKMIENIYSNRMALVVELELDDVDNSDPNTIVFPALKKLEELKLIQPLPDPKDPTYANYVKARKNLFSSLQLKDNVGFFFWFLFIGIFCILVSTNTILSSSCSPKVAKSYDSIFK